MTMLILCLGTIAQVPKSHGKPTELVVKQYEKFIADGALLTPESWQLAAKLFDSANPYPKNGVIFLTSTSGLIGETWSDGHQARVETKWADSYGSIDSALRYKPIDSTGSMLTFYVYDLALTDKYLNDKGKVTTGTWQWKIKGPLKNRSATLRGAIRYVTKMRDKSDDPIIKKNADKTLVILRRMQHQCGSGSAC